MTRIPTPRLIVPSGYISQPEAASRLGLHIDTVRDEIKRGHLIASALPGSRRAFVREESLRRYAERRGIVLK